MMDCNEAWTCAVNLAAAGFMTTICLADPLIQLRSSENASPSIWDFEVQRSSDFASSHLEFSADLRTWYPFAASGESSWRHEIEFSARNLLYFRAAASVDIDIPQSDAWSHQLEFRQRSAKFIVLLDDPTRVFFQNTQQYPFHFQFATAELPPFKGLNALEYDALTLFPGPNQRAIAGSIAWADEFLATEPHGISVQLLGGDGYPVETIDYLVNLVREAIAPGADWLKVGNASYLPTPSQFSHALANRDYLQERGINVLDPTKPNVFSSTFAPGWTIGNLRYVATDEIEKAFLEGRLTSDDILLTERLPPELPWVKGVLTLSPPVPNSHVVILARSSNIPIVQVRTEPEVAKARALVDQLVALDAREDDSSVSLQPLSDTPSHVLNTLETLTEALRPEIMPIKTLGFPIAIPLQSDTAAGVDEIGGKATGFITLLKSVPEMTPQPAYALTFALWDQFLTQPSGDQGLSLGERIDERLQPFEAAIEISALDAALAEIRDWIRQAPFAEATELEVLEALAAFDPNERIRFRSSTNVEDTESFVGAGLYDSFSGCLADDLDDDDTGPSHCDDSRKEERGVFRAIRKVYASFYNLNAYLARRRFQLAEENTGMAILAHHSFPDETEAANGVMIVEREITSDFFPEVERKISSVTQLGAGSITNPSDLSLPEILTLTIHALINIDNLRSQLGKLLQKSSLLPIDRGHVMETEDYKNLWRGALTVFDAVAGDSRALAIAFFEGNDVEDELQASVEMEFKKLTDGRLIIKQARELPRKEREYDQGVLLGSSDLIVLQNEHGSALANHRLKRHIRVSPTRQTYIRGQGLALDFLVTTAQTNGELVQERFSVSSGNGTHDVTWGTPALVTLKLAFKGPSQLTQPILRLTDFQPSPPSLGFPLEALHDSPVVLPRGYPSWEFSERGREEAIALRPGHPDDPPASDSRLVHRVLKAPGFEVDTQFYWFSDSSIYTIQTVGPTFALDRFLETRITGLTSEPLILDDYYSQTYQSIHHNVGDIFLFEPGLSTKLTDQQCEELRAQDIRAIFLVRFENPVVRLQGLNGLWRDVVN